MSAAMDWETYLDRLAVKVIADAEKQAHDRYQLLADADMDLPPWDEFRQLFAQRLLLAGDLELWATLRDNLVTMAEIARRFQVDRGTVGIWARRDDWPEPKLGTAVSGTRPRQGELYWWPDIEAFRSRHSRPPKSTS